MKPTLVVMAAGMGSRFGGLKQLTPVGPNGEMLLDYCVYDARLAGFGKVVFVIKHAIEEDFKRLVGDRIGKAFPVEYVYQELSDLPEGFTVPEGREKPFGTGQAIWACRTCVHEPFAVVNADDYYGRDCFKLLYDFIMQPHTSGKLEFAMAGYRLANTLTENGSVSRGVCVVDGEGYLKKLDERKRIELRGGKPYFTLDEGESWTELDPDGSVSMNCWACPPETIDILGDMFCDFLPNMVNPLKDEFYLPISIDTLVNQGKATVKVLPTPDKWYGMTYAEDRAGVEEALARMTREGFYPENLWEV